MATITKHGFERAKERLGYNEKTAEHFIRNATQRGKRPEEFRSRKERDWLEKQVGHGCNVIIYNGYCVILTETNICVTLYKVPSWFGKRGCYDGKRQIRDASRYQRYRDIYADAS